MKNAAKTVLLALLVGVWSALFTLGVLYLADDTVSFAFERSLSARLDRMEASLGAGGQAGGAGGNPSAKLEGRLSGLESEIKSTRTAVGAVASSLEGMAAKLDDAIGRLDKTGPQGIMPGTNAATKAAMKGPMAPEDAVTTAAMDGPAALVLTIDFLDVGSFDGAWLDSVVATTTSRIGKAAAGRAGCAVQATGHADTVGKDAANWTLSLKRATAVTRRLQKTLAKDITVKQAAAWGERRLAMLTGDGVDQRANRRVEVVLRCGNANLQS